jgi:hypothetical protein
MAPAPNAQQRPQRQSRRDEQDHSEQYAADDGFVPDVSAAGAEGWHEAFAAILRSGWRPPPKEQRERQEDH